MDPPTSQRLLRHVLGFTVTMPGPGVPDDLPDTDWLTVIRDVTGVVEDVDALLHRPSLN